MEDIKTNKEAFLKLELEKYYFVEFWQSQKVKCKITKEVIFEGSGIKLKVYKKEGTLFHFIDKKGYYYYEEYSNVKRIIEIFPYNFIKDFL